MNYGKQSQMTSQLTYMEGYLFLLKCNCEFKLLDKQPPLFYSEMLDYFKELRTGDSDVYRSEFIFWNNKKITIENKSIIWAHLFEKEICLVQDSNIRFT